MISIPLFLAVVAFALSAYDLITSRGRSILGWACGCLSIALLWGHL